MDPNKKPDKLDAPFVAEIIQRMSKANVWIYKKTKGRIGGTWRVGSAFPWGIPVCLVTTTGRKSGIERTAPVLFIRDGETVIVVGSQGGLPKHPQWYLNLVANPKAKVQIRGEQWDVVAHVANAEERALYWPRLVAHYADFDTYKAWTEREIPVVLLKRA